LVVVQQYDLVVDADDVRSLEPGGRGWTVDAANADALRRSGVVVSVLGIYNRGKTFVLNKVYKKRFDIVTRILWHRTQVTDSSLPASLRTHTRGVSLKSPHHWATQNLMLLDTAGLQAPVSGPHRSDFPIREFCSDPVVVFLATRSE
jgi:hypothetical protein